MCVKGEVPHFNSLTETSDEVNKNNFSSILPAGRAAGIGNKRYDAQLLQTLDIPYAELIIKAGGEFEGHSLMKLAMTPRQFFAEVDAFLVGDDITKAELEALFFKVKTGEIPAEVINLFANRIYEKLIQVGFTPKDLEK